MEKLMTFNLDNPCANPRSIQWGKPESRTAYGHSQSRHGQRVSLQSLKDRARSLNAPQGQFYDDMTIVEAERQAPKSFGVHITHFDNPIGRVVHPDGTVTENVNKVLVVRKRDGTVRTSYPIIEESEHAVS